MSPATKSLKEYLKFPVSISLDSNGRIFIVDQNDGGIVILGQDGSDKGRQLGMGWNEGFLRYPSQICITKAGSLFVADRGNNRVQIFSIQEK
jgi:DNA-binding beta-propeller fold protein YncE